METEIGVMPSVRQGKPKISGKPPEIGERLEQILPQLSEGANPINTLIFFLF